MRVPPFSQDFLYSQVREGITLRGGSMWSPPQGSPRKNALDLSHSEEQTVTEMAVCTPTPQIRPKHPEYSTHACNTKLYFFPLKPFLKVTNVTECPGLD